MSVRKKNPKPAKGPQTVVIGRAVPPELPLEVIIDAAVEEHFKDWQVRCHTRVSVSPRSSGKLVSHISQGPEGRPLPPMRMKLVRAYLAGFMACERSYVGAEE